MSIAETCHKFLLVACGSLMLGLFMPITSPAADCSFKVASFNIHYIVTMNGPDREWEERKAAVTEVLRRVDADIIAFQEMETFKGEHYSRENLQLDWIVKTLPGYEIAAFGDAEIFPVTQPVLFRPEKFASQEQGFFFYSARPDEIYSQQWDGGYPYFSTWVRLASKCKQESLFLINVHNDYGSRDNRIRTSHLIAERAKLLSRNDPVIVLGDFNVRSTAKEIKILEETGLVVVEPSRSTNRIWGLHLMPAIDHFIIDPRFETAGPIRVWRDKVNGQYPSDHYPISLELAW